MKYIFVAVFLMMLQASPAPPRHSKTDAAPVTTTSPPPVTVNCNQSAGAVAEHEEKKAPEWSATIQWSNWALVLVGGITAWAVWFQAQKTAEATEEMQKSTALEKAQLVQWVTIDEWSGGEDIYLSDEEKFLHNLMFIFYIVNPTNHPMSLIRADWTIGKQQDGIAIDELTFPPRGRHSTITQYRLTPEEFDSYRNGKLFDLNIEGSITFIDVSKVQQVQRFSITLSCAFQKGVVGVKAYKSSGWEANIANKKVWAKSD